MKINRRRILLTVAGIAVMVWLVWQFHHSKEWQRFSWTAMWNATADAEGWYIAASVVLIYASYVIRAFRWQVFMSPGGRFWPILKGTVIGFTGTALLGRPAELVRPYYIARKHRSEISTQLAVWVLERVFDMAGVVFLVGLDLALNAQLKSLTRDSVYQHAFEKTGLVLSIGLLVVLSLLYLFHLRAKHILEGLQRRNAAHPSRLRQRYTRFLHTLAMGLGALSNARTLLAAVGLTALLWLDVTATIWLVVRAYPAMLPGFSFSYGILLMGLTAVGAVIQLPAVGGGFQVLTIFGLTQVFGANSAAATSAALIIWLVCFYAIAPIGILLTMREGISWRGLEQESLEAETAS